MYINKKTLIILAAVVLFSGILTAPAVTHASLINIAALKLKVYQLQAQLLDVLKGIINSAPSSAPAQNPAASLEKEIDTIAVYNYTRDLEINSEGADVSALQQALINGGYLNISEPTAYFGPATKTALTTWQKDNSINPSGYFGPLSQAKISGLSETSTNATGATSASNPGTNNLAANYDQSPATFIETYHIWDKTEGLGVAPLKNGGYLLTGDIISDAGVYYPFITKIDASGNVVWSERSDGRSNVYSESSSRHVGRIAVETTDGNIVLVSDTPDFIDAEYEKSREAYGDVLITKLNSKGVKLWSIMVGDYGTDQPQRLWALSDGGVMLLARFTQIGYGDNIADSSVLPKYSALIKIDKNGQVQSSKKMDWNAVSMERLADGSFVALANIAIPESEQPEIMGSKATTGKLPIIIKLNSALNVEWAKSIESVSLELNVPTGITNGSLTANVIKLRTMGGDFKSVQPTSDGGFIAFGYASLSVANGISGQQIMQSAAMRPIIAVKVDANGKYLWARKLTGSLSSAGVTSIDFQTAKTIDSGFVILQEVVRDGNWQSYEGNLKALTQAWAINIELIKTDADFNAKWIKKFDVEKNLFGYDIQPTADGGVAVAGMIKTDKMHMVMGSMESYEEAILVKTDVNGEVGGCAVSSSHSSATVEDQSQNLIVQNMGSVGGAKNLVLNVNKKINEKISAVQNTARGICEYKKNEAAPVNSYLNTNISVPQIGTAAVSPVAKTWAQTSFESAKEAQIDSEKNRKIHEELLPILNKVFDNQVKMTDSMSGMWLTYNFPRLVTRADVEAVQKHYEGLGYKIDESEGGSLNVSKVGLSIRMTFSISNPMKGKLDVML